MQLWHDSRAILRAACVLSMQEDGMTGYRLLADRTDNEAYAAVFISGNRLVLARIPDRRAAMLEVHVSEFEQVE